MLKDNSGHPDELYHKRNGDNLIARNVTNLACSPCDHD